MRYYLHFHKFTHIIYILYSISGHMNKTLKTKKDLFSYLMLQLCIDNITYLSSNMIYLPYTQAKATASDSPTTSILQPPE